MNTKQTKAQLKAQLISQINNLREDAEFHGIGYSFITDADLQKQGVATLEEFLHETNFLIEEIKEIEKIKIQQGRVTH